MRLNSSKNKGASRAGKVIKTDSLAILSMAVLGAGSSGQMVFAAPAPNAPSQLPKLAQQSQTYILRNYKHSVLLAQGQKGQSDQQRERGFLEAFARSKFSYIDAKILARHWKTDIGNAKARIGSKVSGEHAAIGEDTVEQMLLDARVPELCAVDGKQALNYFPDSTYTYDDAVVLAKLWGEPSPWEAKVRIERNLIMGNDQVVKRALGLAQRHFNGR